MGRWLPGKISQIFTAKRTEGCGSAFPGGIDRKREAFSAVVLYGGCCAGQDNFEKHGDGEPEFCAGGKRKEARGCA